MHSDKLLVSLKVVGRRWSKWEERWQCWWHTRLGWSTAIVQSGLCSAFLMLARQGFIWAKHLLHVLHVRYIVNFDLITHRLTQLHSNCQSTFITVKKKKKTQCLEKQGHRLHTENKGKSYQHQEPRRTACFGPPAAEASPEEGPCSGAVQTRSGPPVPQCSRGTHKPVGRSRFLFVGSCLLYSDEQVNELSRYKSLIFSVCQHAKFLKI